MKQLYIILILLSVSILGFAQAFEVNGVYYQVTSTSNNTVEVSVHPNKYQEPFYVIPEKIKYNDKEYSVTGIGHQSFVDCDKLTYIVLPNSLTVIGDAAFSSCSSLTKIIIPENVTEIGDFAFYRCEGLTSITIPNSVISIGDEAFSKCSNLNSAIIGNSVTNIGVSAFSECIALSSITIPESVTQIGDFAFIGCENLKTMYNKAGIPQKKTGSLSAPTIVHVKKGLLNTYKSSDAWKELKIVDDIEYNKLTKITLNKQRVNCKVNDISKIDIVSLEPNNADNKQVLFASSDSDVVIITEEGQFIAIKKGRATITVTAKDGGGTIAQCEVLVE